MAELVYTLQLPENAPSTVYATAGIAEPTYEAFDAMVDGTGPLPRIVVLSATASRMAPHVVHVRLDGTDESDSYPMATTTNGVGDWTTVNISWDFGESGVQMVDDPRPGKVGQRTFDLGTDQRGFNACYLYTTSGTKTITVSLWNEDGELGTDSTEVTVVGDTRGSKYVDGTDGSNGGDGSIGSPWEDIDYAINQLSSATKLMLKRGTTITFSSASSVSVDTDNTWIAPYGVGADPIVIPNASSPHTLFSLNAENILFDGIRCNAGTFGAAAHCFTATGSSVHNVCIKDYNTNSTVSGNRWDNLVNWEPGSQVFRYGLCLQNVRVDNVDTNGGAERYNWGVQGNGDVCILGGRFGGTLDSHTLRPAQGYGPSYPTVEAGRRFKIEFCYIRGHDSGTLDTMRFGGYAWLFMSRNYTKNTSHLRLSFQDNLCTWTVLEGNYFQLTQQNANTYAMIYVCNHAEYVAIRSNIFDVVNMLSINFAGRQNDALPDGAEYYSDVKYPKILNNTFFVDTAIARPFLDASCASDRTPADWGWWGIEELQHNNNLVICDAEISRIISDRPDTYFLESKNNVYPSTSGTFLKGKDAQPNLTFSQWSAKSYATNETTENLDDTDVVSPDFYCPQSSTADTHAEAADAPGVRWDYNGHVRDINASDWSAGAVEGAFRDNVYADRIDIVYTALEATSIMIFVVGPGRCGTSAVADVLRALGVDMGSWFWPKQNANPWGDWEDLEFKCLHYAIQDGLLPRPVFRSLIQRIAATKKEPWGLKDPKICYAIEEYQRVFPQAKFVRLLRESEEVVDSMVRAYGWSREESEQLCASREQCYDQALSTWDRKINISWYQLRGSPVETVSRLAEFCGLEYVEGAVDRLRFDKVGATNAED